MIGTLLNHEWKAFLRARNARANIIINILVALFALYLLSLAIGFGMFLGRILGKIFPGL